jgi:predicted ATPase
MLFKRIKVSGLLSFGPSGIDLPLRSLNIFIGANGSGKSNLLEVLGLLRAAPKTLSVPIKAMGGLREWLWKGTPAAERGVIDAFVKHPEGFENFPDLHHSLALRQHGTTFDVAAELIEDDSPQTRIWHYRWLNGQPELRDAESGERRFKPGQMAPDESILSQLKDPERYPALSMLQAAYAGIRLYRNWTFGPAASMRLEQSSHARTDFLDDGGENLTLVLNQIRPKVRKEFIHSLKKLYAGIEGWEFSISAGNLQLFLEESGGREIPASRLSDGTMRYLALLAILLHPEPPQVVAIEEPELGLHPDIIPHVAELLVRASERTQLFITTHSRMLIDALGDQPESVVVCSKEGGETRMERLSPEHLREWLERYSLGDLWSKGELGGNRW